MATRKITGHIEVPVHFEVKEIRSLPWRRSSVSRFHVEVPRDASVVVVLGPGDSVDITAANGATALCVATASASIQVVP